jgi:hypothetical protein
MAFHKTKAKQLRDEAFREMWRGLWVLLTKAIGRRRRRSVTDA